MAELLFKNCRIINVNNYKSLSEIQLKQMALGATMGFGKEYNTPEHFLEQCGDGDIEEGGVELWDIVDQKKPNEVLYECWYYLGDTANVFFAATANDTQAAMCQGSFDDHTKDGSNEQLCADLQKAYYNIG
jgi:hypothetical protein